MNKIKLYTFEKKPFSISTLTKTKKIDPENKSTDQMWKSIFIIQGGGAKGAWQGSVINELIDSGHIDVIGSIGSSAGAINTCLISQKLEDRSVNPFNEFWLNTNKHIWSFVFHLLPRISKFITSYLASDFPEKPPVTALISREFYVDFYRKNLNVKKTHIYKYIHTTDLGLNTEIGIEDGLNHPMFMSVPNETNLLFLTEEDQRFDYAEAVATSSSLPFIEPMSHGGKYYADAGLFSNFPLHIIFRNGDLGGELVLCICATSISNLDYKNDYVDWMMMKQLVDFKHKKEEDQKNRLNGRARTPLGNAKVLVLQPSMKLKSATARGFFCKDLMEEDIKTGKGDVKKLIDALKLYGQSPLMRVLKDFDIMELALPKVMPPRPPINKLYKKVLNWNV